jgi:hypothetical protein
MIPHELWDEPFDRAALLRQFESGERENKTALDWINDVESARFYDAWRKRRDLWDNQQDEMRAAEYPEDGETWQSAYEDYQKDVTDLEDMYPTAYKEFKTRSDMGSDPKVEDMLRRAAANQIFSGTDAGQFLNWYWENRDPLAQHMYDHNESSLYNPSSEGQKKHWEAQLEEAFKRWPDGERIYNLFLRDDLYGPTETHRDDLRLELYNNRSAWRDQGQWEKDWNEAQSTVSQGSNPAEVERGYIQLRTLANTATSGEWDFRLNPMEMWWETRTDSQRKYYLNGVRNRPAVFWSAFDREKMKIKTDAYSEYAWLETAKDRNAISQYIQDNPGIREFNNPQMFAASDSFIRDRMKHSPTFRNQIIIANEWGWAWKNSHLTEGDTNAAQAWRYVFDYLHSMQVDLTLKDATGEKDRNKANQIWWQVARDELESYMNDAASKNEIFRAQLKDIEESNGGTPFAYQLIPDSYFPLGGMVFEQGVLSK